MLNDEWVLVAERSSLVLRWIPTHNSELCSLVGTWSLPEIQAGTRKTSGNNLTVWPGNETSSHKVSQQHLQHDCIEIIIIKKKKLFIQEEPNGNKRTLIRGYPGHLIRSEEVKRGKISPSLTDNRAKQQNTLASCSLNRSAPRQSQAEEDVRNSIGASMGKGAKLALTSPSTEEK